MTDPLPPRPMTGVLKTVLAVQIVAELALVTYVTLTYTVLGGLVLAAVISLGWGVWAISYESSRHPARKAGGMAPMFVDPDMERHQ